MESRCWRAEWGAGGRFILLPSSLRSPPLLMSCYYVCSPTACKNLTCDMFICMCVSAYPRLHAQFWIAAWARSFFFFGWQLVSILGCSTYSPYPHALTAMSRRHMCVCVCVCARTLSRCKRRAGVTAQSVLTLVSISIFREMQSKVWGEFRCLQKPIWTTHMCKYLPRHPSIYY